MAVQDYFDSLIAYNPDNEELVAGAAFQVYAVDDASYSTPLPLTDPVSGAAITTLQSSNIGVLPDFRVSGDPVQVILKSGAFVTKLTSRLGVFKDAGFDPDEIALAIAAAPAAEAARDAALEAQAAVEAIGTTNDAIMTSVAADEDSTFATALKNTMLSFSAPIAPRASWVAMGDSNTANPSGVEVTGGGSTAENWYALTTVMLDGAARGDGRYARATYTTKQVMDAKLAQVLALDPFPGAVVAMVGTNDVSRGTAGSAYDEEEAADALEAFIVAVLNKGGLPVLVTPIPPNHTAGGSVLVNDQAWRRREATLAAAYRIPIFDGAIGLIDPATGGIKAAYQQDTVHVNALGHRVLASSLIAQGFGRIFPPRQPRTSKSVADPDNEVTSGWGMFLADAGWTSNTAGTTTGYTVTRPTPAAGEGVLGNWQQVYLPNTGTVNRQMTAIILPDTPATGDVIEFTCRVETEGIEAAVAGGLTPVITLRAALYPPSGMGGVLAYATLLLGSPNWRVDVERGTATTRVAWPAGATRFVIEHSISAASPTYPITTRIAEVTLRNLTALGLA
ncbi:SGNH/GDSL hydrolase family protein [Microbacterium trichothecenolyticum]